jgi:hypothetical protein
VLAQWGDILFDRNDPTGGNGKYQEAIQASPSLAWVYNNWRVSLENHGYSGDAVEKYKQALGTNRTPQ